MSSIYRTTRCNQATQKERNKTSWCRVVLFTGESTHTNAHMEEAQGFPRHKSKKRYERTTMQVLSQVKSWPCSNVYVE